MTDSDWYARHLGGGAGRGTPPPVPPSASPYYQPQAYQPPPGYVLVPAQQAPQDLGIPGLPSFSGHHNPWAEPPPPPIDTARIPRGAVNAENFLHLANYWRGGPGKKEAQHCPRCDGVLFRRFEGRREAAPLCEGCGWNGLWDQGEHAHTAA